MELRSELLGHYRALGEACGFHVFDRRTILELTGPDRAKFLHNFCTAEINRLTPGQGSEAFITSVQGKTLGYLNVAIGRERIVLEGADGQAAGLLPHLGKYIVLNDAELHDRSAQWASVLVAGSAAAAILNECLGAELPQSPGANLEVTAHGETLLIVRSGLAGPDTYHLIGPRPAAEACCGQLEAAGAIRCSLEAVEMRRIEAGSPQFGSDVTEANLPQEVGRDAQAISFSKGCYLGQETVARIDALGHVNRYLRVIRFAGDTLPEPGWEHAIEGKTAVRVTSSTFSPLLSAPLALAYVRRGSEKPGTTFETELGRAEVIEPPARW